MKRGDAILVGCGAVALALPFLDKAYVIDDPLMLRISESLLRDPLDPFAGIFDWASLVLPLRDVATNPPLISYYLAPFAALSDYSEVVLHAAMLPFLALFALSVLSLATRFTSSPRLATLFAVTSPGILVSINVMQDVPNAALTAAAVAAFVAGTDRRSHRLLWLGSLLAGLAVLIKYSAAIVVPLLALYALIRGRARLALWSLGPLLAFGLWCAHNLGVSGEFHFLNVAARASGALVNWRPNLLAVPLVVGSLLFLAPAVVWRGLERRDAVLLATAAFACAAFGWGIRAFSRGEADAQYLLWSLAGVVLLASCAVEGLRSGWPWLRQRSDREAADSLFLFAWVCAPLLFSSIFPPFQAVKHLLPALPPLVLLAFRYLGGTPASRGRALGIGLTALLVLQLSTALLVAAADYERGAAYRDFASQVRTRWGADRRVWFVGHYGWYFYAKRAGLHQIHPSGARPGPGDLVIWPAQVNRGRSLPTPQSLGLELEAVDRIEYRGEVPARTMSRGGAGFYALLRGRPGRRVVVPYRFFDDSPLEVFEVYEVSGAK